MEKVKKILFPTDFSEPAANAFRYALLLADKMEASIEVLHVVFPQGESLDFPVMVAQATQQQLEVNRKLLNKFVQTGMTQVLQQIKNAPSVSTDLQIGTVIHQVVDIAKRDSIDMIMMGSKGENRSRVEKLIGSVASGVVKDAHCPVLIVPENTPFKSLERMVYASNVKESDAFEIWKSLQLLKAFNPMIHCVHFNYKKDGDLEAWDGLQEIKHFFEQQDSDLQIEFHHLPGKNWKMTSMNLWKLIILICC